MLFSVCDAAKSLNFVVVVLCPTTVCHCFVVCGVITPCAYTRGKAIGFVCLSLSQKSPDLEFYTSMRTTNW